MQAVAQPFCLSRFLFWTRALAAVLHFSFPCLHLLGPGCLISKEKEVFLLGGRRGGLRVMLEASPGADVQHTVPDKATASSTSDPALPAPAPRTSTQTSTECSIQMASPQLQELASEEKTSEIGGLQKGSLELVLQQKGELLLLSSSHQQKK